MSTAISITLHIAGVAFLATVALVGLGLIILDAALGNLDPGQEADQ